MRSDTDSGRQHRSIEFKCIDFEHIASKYIDFQHDDQSQCQLKRWYQCAAKQFLHHSGSNRNGEQRRKHEKHVPKQHDDWYGNRNSRPASLPCAFPATAASVSEKLMACT